MPALASFLDPKTFHITAWGLAIGSNFFNSFIGGPVAFKALPRPQFATLQTKLVPVYFALECVYPVVLALTLPGEKLASAGGNVLSRDAGFAGLLAEEHRWTALVPIASAFVTSVLNALVWGPWTTKVMKERKHQETREGKKYYDQGPKSTEMQRLNKSFMWLHSASALTNLLGLGALAWYGATLAEKL
ncbi:hypothetical protein K431DRAFT_286752 [Polychaeton citri CBS 116435]|uniref:TMEM205-like domain-containing protein n=1 Tax=Polychaeton citri CBS 116435 TaxID=1314669 RepID=A0A9P4UN59_9PEZI|nr:hypothetical protein K431DRAFT_286752 [Polychaeton citri CBS 116435]